MDDARPIVRSGLFGRRIIAIAVSEVVEILPHETRIVVQRTGARR